MQTLNIETKKNKNLLTFIMLDAAGGKTEP